MSQPPKLIPYAKLEEQKQAVARERMAKEHLRLAEEQTSPKRKRVMDGISEAPSVAKQVRDVVDNVPSQRNPAVVKDSYTNQMPAFGNRGNTSLPNAPPFFFMVPMVAMPTGSGNGSVPYQFMMPSSDSMFPFQFPGMKTEKVTSSSKEGDEDMQVVTMKIITKIPKQTSVEEKQPLESCDPETEENRESSVEFSGEEGEFQEREVIATPDDTSSATSDIEAKDAPSELTPHSLYVMPQPHAKIDNHVQPAPPELGQADVEQSPSVYKKTLGLNDEGCPSSKQTLKTSYSPGPIRETSSNEQTLCPTQRPQIAQASSSLVSSLEAKATLPISTSAQAVTPGVALHLAQRFIPPALGLNSGIGEATQSLLTLASAASSLRNEAACDKTSVDQQSSSNQEPTADQNSRHEQR